MLRDINGQYLVIPGILILVVLVCVCVWFSSFLDFSDVKSFISCIFLSLLKIFLLDFSF